MWPCTQVDYPPDHRQIPERQVFRAVRHHAVHLPTQPLPDQRLRSGLVEVSMFRFADSLPGSLDFGGAVPV